MVPIVVSRISFFWVLQILLYVFLGVLLIWYISFQARLLIAGPQITLTVPEGTVQDKRIINVGGTTENITELTLNGKSIHTNEQGQFNESLVLQNGYTIMTLRAKDRFGREKVVTKHIVLTNSS